MAYGECCRVGEDGTLGVYADDPYVRVLFLEITASAGYGPAGTHPCDEVGYAALGLAPELRARRLVVGQGIGRVLVLSRLEAAGDLIRQPLGDGVVAFGVFGWRGRRTITSAPMASRRSVLL